MLKKSELTIYLTNRCNLSCKYCYVKNGQKQLTDSDIFWILDNIKNKRTTFLGGEPLLYPYLKDCTEIFPQVTLSTNATLINEDTIHLIKAVKGVQLSVGMGKQETEDMRGPGIWDTVLKAHKLLEKESIEHYFRASFWTGNIEYLKEFIDLDVQLALFPRFDKPAMPGELTRMLFEEVLKHENWILALPNFLQYIGKNGRCKAGSERLNIFYDGKITPCNFDLEYYFGKIGDYSGDIERNIQNYLEINKKIPDECIGCKNSEVCRGSCYATHASAGCPLKYNYSIQDFLSRYHIDEATMKRHIDNVSGFMKRMLVC